MRAILLGLSNLSVGNRLYLGFGLTCLLTLVVGLSGFKVIDLLTAGNDRASDLSQVQLLVLRVQVAERTFAHQRSDEAAGQVRALVAQLSDYLHRHPGLPGRETLDVAKGQYLEEFERFDRLQQDALQARVKMQQQADEVRRSFETLEQDFFDAAKGLDEQAAISAAEALDRANDVAELVRMLLTLRTLEFTWDLQPSAEHYDAWHTFNAGITENLESLSRQVEGPHRSALQDALKALQHYTEAFVGYRDGMHSSASSQTRMIGLAQQMLGLSASAYDHEAALLHQQSRSFLLGMGLILLFSMLLSVLAAWLIRRLTLQPLRETLVMARRVADGDLREESPCPRRDEFGELQQAMHGMTGNLRGLVGHIQRGVSQLSRATEGLGVLSRESLDGMDRQRSETEQTASAVQQLAASAQSVAEDGARASQAALEADDRAKRGEQVVLQMLGQIRLLSDGMQQTAGSVARLDEQSRSIVRVLDVIKALAEQTNLLALNAAIEAARAGEYGRGFAVVADGVRGLAGRTRQSAGEIEGTIDQLLHVTTQVVQEMQSGLALIDDSLLLAEEAGSSLEYITRMASVIEQRNQQIAAAAEEQSSVVEQISDRVVRICDVTQLNVATNHQIDLSTQEVSNLGRQLTERIEFFRNF
nr:methyl-accepting chemotaxis protein [Pseudomonas sp. Marseille-P9899]